MHVGTPRCRPLSTNPGRDCSECEKVEQIPSSRRGRNTMARATMMVSTPHLGGARLFVNA